MICIVSHDAGGAEILSSYVRQSEGPYLYSLAGPALKVFSAKLGSVESLPLEDAIGRSEWVLCGTSWQSDIEWRAIGLARASGKLSVAFLDHWVNYHERFLRGGIRHLPDQIWVGDAYAKALAENEFPDTTLRLLQNPYFADIRLEVGNLKNQHATVDKYEDAVAVLFVCENISEHAALQYGDPRYWGYTEFDAIEFFFKKISVLGVTLSSVVIRPHPSDPIGKYDQILIRYAGLASLSIGKTLLEDIAQADIVVGCESMAMVIAVQCGRRVISCIPLNEVALKLPFEEIEILSELVSD
jgi:hypothetical protein